MTDATTQAGHPGGAYAAGWYPDPLHRYDHRWFNGTAWTSDVSLRGQRYVDPRPLADGPAVGPGVTTPSGRLPRGLAVFALITGLGAVLTTWLPFIVFLGIVSAALAIGLGIAAHRRIRAGQAEGRGMATAGIVLGVLGLALCPIGIVLTTTTTREFSRFLQAGPSEVLVTSCVHDAGVVTVAGSLRNTSDGEMFSYVIFVDVVDDRTTLTTLRVGLDDVEAGATRTWRATGGASGSQPVTCRVSIVTGPFPFGIPVDP